jgi:CheY-like chemotaxis protein
MSNDGEPAPMPREIIKASPDHSTLPDSDLKAQILIRTWSSRVHQISRAAVSVLKVVAFTALLVWVVADRDFLKDSLRSLTHAELFGVKLDRKAIDDATSALQELLKEKRESIDKNAEAAIRRSARVAPAIVHAKILWVDDNPQNNMHERSILAKLKIDVTVATSTAEALRALRRTPFDLIISDIDRPRDPMMPLKRCQIHYFDYPNDELRERYNKPSGFRLEGFNADQNKSGPAGFSMIEQLVPEYEAMPRVIFYTRAENASIRSLCGDRITDRPDILLQTVVSILEEERWDRLPDRE